VERPFIMWSGAVSFHAAAASARGRGHAHNEDDFAVLEQFGLLVLADGVGGQEGGAQAARIAVEAVRETCGVSCSDPDRAQRDLLACRSRRRSRRRASPAARRGARSSARCAAGCAFDLANMEVRSVAQRRGPVGRATMLLVARALDDQVWIGHVSDSRAFLLREGRMRRLTTDHIVANELEKVPPGVRPDLLTRAIGLSPTVKCDVAHEMIRMGAWSCSRLTDSRVRCSRMR
jgi:PPM family protein phosphatase